MVIGKNIKSIRELKNYTQEYVANQLGMTQAGYSKIEKGITSLRLEKLQQLALILDLPLENIIHFESHRYFNQDKIVSKAPGWCTDKNFELVAKLYEDKIALLEKLLNKTDQELKFYKEKCLCCN